MKRDNTDIKVALGAMLLCLIIYGLLQFDAVNRYLRMNPAHDHKVYTYPWANGHRTSTFTVCGDSTIVSSDTERHWGFIPQRLEAFINEENRVR